MEAFISIKLTNSLFQSHFFIFLFVISAVFYGVQSTFLRRAVRVSLEMSGLLGFIEIVNVTSMLHCFVLPSLSRNEVCLTTACRQNLCCVDF